MKVIRLLCGFCFLLFLSFPSMAQFGGGGLGGSGLGGSGGTGGGSGTSQGCNSTWTYTGFSANGSSFTGTGSATTTITNFQGSSVNGWVNFVVDGTRGNTASTYEMLLTLGNTPYKIVYKAARFFGSPPFQFRQDGFLDIQLFNTSIFSSPITTVENRTVFRIAREGNMMRFYKNNDLISTPSISANTNGGAEISVSTNSDGRIRTTIFSPFCQELVPDFTINSLDCNSGLGNLSISTVQGGTAPYFHYFDNASFNTTQSISTPTFGWVTTLDNDYRAATYYMGVGREIAWQHTGTQLNGNILTSLTPNGITIPSNLLSSQDDGWIGFRKESSLGWTVGFIDAITSTYLYEFRGRSDLQSDIYIGGTRVAIVQSLLTDYLRISREGNEINFYVNEVEVHSQVISNTNELKGKFGFTSLGSTISYPTLSFCTPIDPPVITLASTDLSACQYENIPVITPTTQNVTELRWYESNPDGVSIIPIHRGFSFDPDPNYPSPSLSAGTYTYYVTGIDQNGQETSSQAITLTVHVLPDTYIRPIEPLCPGTSEVIEVFGASLGSSYQWYKDNILLSGNTNESLTVTVAGIYQVEITLPQGCVVVEDYNVREYNMPTLTLAYESGIGCGYTTLQAAISDGYTVYYVEIKNSNGIWTPVNVNGAGPDRNQFILPTQPHIPGIGTNTYRIYYRDIITGCRSYSNELDVTVYPLPQTTISAPTACQGDDVTLTILNYNSSYSYQWQEYVSGVWENRISTTPTTLNVPYVVGTTSTAFQVITTDPSFTGCSNVTSRSVYYAPSPMITYTSFIEAEIGDPVNFNVVGAANYTYQWTYPNGFISSTPPITVTATSYGEYTLTVSNGNCQTIYTAVIVEKGVFATLKENLDASYYHTNKEGKLYFKFDEKYGLGATGLASVSIFNYDFQEVTQTSLSKEYGYNWYELDLSIFGVEGDQYVLHIKDELERRYVLRVKYATGNNKISIGEDFTTCISQSDQLVTVRLDAMSYVDISPYSIYWYVSTDYTKINNLESLSSTERDALLFKEEQNIDQQSSTTLFSTQQNYINQNVLYAPNEGTYYVRAKIKNYCNEEETYSDQVVIITLNLDPSCRVASSGRIVEKKHRFEFFFSIRRLLSPKPNTNPTTR